REIPAATVTNETSISPESKAEPFVRRFWLIAGLAVFGILIALIFWRAQFSHPYEPADRTIAVLPFKPVVPAHGDPVLEMGMADALIAKLTNLQDIVVRPLSSVRKYAAPEQDALAAGRALQVESVLDGEIQRSGDHVRVITRLIKIPNGSVLWSATFDEPFTDVFGVQDAISQRVAEALAVRLSGEEKKRIVRHGTARIEAYQMYLTGRYHWNKLTPPEIATSIKFFRQAIALDPEYAQAYFGMAEAYRALAITGDMPPKESMPHAKAAATKALAIDDSLAEAHASLVFIHTWYDRDWAAAEREARRAIALSPNYGMAHSAYAQLLSDLGRHPEAMAEAARARELDPVSLIVNTIEGSVLYFAGEDEEAAASLKKTLELDPNFWIARLFLGKVYLNEKRYADALVQFGQAEKNSHGNSEAIAMSGYAAAVAGDRLRATQILDQLNSAADQRYVPPFNLAVVHLGLGQRDEVFAALERAYQDRDVRLSFLKVDPKWNGVRSDARFASLMSRLGL
ncbi:MAG: tetratricopeptide repeat protein, partial [Chthoniobacterales bacterium]